MYQNYHDALDRYREKHGYHEKYEKVDDTESSKRAVILKLQQLAEVVDLVMKQEEKITSLQEKMEVMEKRLADLEWEKIAEKLNG